MKFFPTIILTLLTITVLNTGLHAQSDAAEKPERKVSTLIKNSDTNYNISGYGALTGSYTRIKGKDSWLAGIRGSAIIDNFAVGLNINGLTYPDKRKDFGDNTFTDEKEYIDFNYGGFLTEYYFSPASLVHFSIGTTIGGGLLTFYDKDDDSSSDAFFVIEPEVSMFVNITSFCRVGIGGSYRYTNGIEKNSYEDKDFSGFNAHIIAAFGCF